jgi:hypothetical protein
VTRANKDPAHQEAPGAPKAPAEPKHPRKPRTKKTYVYPAHLRNSKPRFSRCHLCGLQTLTCTYDALPLRLDPHPLSLAGEIVTASLGLRTWLLSCGNVWRRNVWCIQSSPTGTGGTIHREHHCDRGHPTPQEVKTLESPHRDTEPPF